MMDTRPPELTHTGLHRVTGGELTTVLAADLVDHLGQVAEFYHLSDVVDVEVVGADDVGHHHPLDG